MNCKLGIAILYARNLEAERRFYTEKLGMSVVPEASEPYFAVLAVSGDAMLALQDAATEKIGAPGPAGGVGIGFEVDDADKVWKELNSKGVATLEKPSDMPFGRAFHLFDPEGHRLTIYQPPAHR